MKYAIVGRGGYEGCTREKIEKAHPGYTIWGLNDFWTRYPDMVVDVAIQLHVNLPDDPMPGIPDRWKNWIEKLNELGSRVIVGEDDPRLPAATTCPMQHIEDTYGIAQCTSSLSCAALVAYEYFHASHIAFWGCPLSLPTEYGHQAPGLLRTINLLESRGVEIKWPERKNHEAITVDWWRVRDVDLMGYWKL